MNPAARRAALVALLTLSITFAARADDPAPAAAPRIAPRGVPIGDVVPDFQAVDADGVAFSLAGARTIAPEGAVASVLAAAKAAGTTDASEATKIDAVVAAGGPVDPARRVAFIQAAWRPYGLVASESSTKAFDTLGDLAKRIVASASAPIVLFAWASTCPTIALYQDRLLEWFSATGARVFPFACSGDETLESIHAAVKEKSLPWRILVDADAKIADLLGARTTPHTFVLDEKNVLRFDGAPDSDPALMAEESKRIPYLLNALTAVSTGRSVEIRMTNPKGCRIRRKKA